MRWPPIKVRQRLADFLRRRGFDWETIQGTKLWKELNDDEYSNKLSNGRMEEFFPTDSVEIFQNQKIPFTLEKSGLF